MAWRLAKSLERLRDEMNRLAPHRSKRSDGTIGDQAHQAEPSDHNPNSRGVVCAMDITHDPAHGADMRTLSEFLRTHRHPALKYLIWDRRITGAWTGWKWVVYYGSNPHNKHMHVSVGVGTDGHSTGPYDNASSWRLSTQEDDMELSDKVTVPKWLRENFDDLGGTISVQTALASGYGHARSTKEYVLRLEKASRLREEAILKAVTGIDTDAILAAINARAAEDAARDAALEALVEGYGDGTLQAGEVADRVVEILADKLTGTEA